jgi:hypothetical protein
MTNHPNRTPGHGHLPGHVRDTFSQAIDAFINSEPGASVSLVPYEIRYRERMISVAEACRLVWNCTDILPGGRFRELQDCLRDPPVSQTYAAAARALVRELQETGQVDVASDIARRRLYDARDAAWRDLEDWIFTENSDRLSEWTRELGAPPDRDRALMRAWVGVAAEKAVEQWRERTERTPATSLEQLLECIVVAEEAIETSRRREV